MNLIKLLLIFSFSLIFISSASSQEYNKKNSKNQKIGEWRGYFENGKLRYIGQFENDIPVDTFLHYFPTGKLQSLLIYKSPIVAYATHFYDTGELMAKGKYLNQKKDSIWLTFGADNVVVEKGGYVKGKKEGKWYTLYENGSTSAVVNYVNDLKDGSYVMYFPDGKVREESVFVKGKLHGLSVIYDTNGKKVLKGLYKNGERDKNWIYYKENQEVEKVLEYENGELKNPDDLKMILDNVDQYKGNRKDVLEFEDLRGKISYE